MSMDKGQSRSCSLRQSNKAAPHAVRALCPMSSFPIPCRPAHVSRFHSHHSCPPLHVQPVSTAASRGSAMVQGREPAHLSLQHLAQRLHAMQQQHPADTCEQAGTARVPSLVALELYSGLGGMRYSLQRCLGPDMQAAVHAVDINPVANNVYAHNFGHRPRALNLEHCTVKQLDALAAELWTMSPPCQPFTTTTQSRRLDTKDARANSYTHLLGLLPQLQKPPQYIFLENVEGFINSEGHALLLDTLRGMQYSYMQFLLSPHQYGVPNLRPRYFMLAKRGPQQFMHPHLCQQGVQCTPPPLPLRLAARCMPHSLQRHGITSQAYLQPVVLQQHGFHLASTRTGEDSMQLVLPAPSVSGLAGGVSTAAVQQEGLQATGSAGQPRRTPVGTELCYPLHLFLEQCDPDDSDIRQGDLQGQISRSDAECLHAGNSSTSVWGSHAVGHADLRRFWKVLDVVTPDSQHTNCVTKNYGRNILGAGSYLASSDFAKAYCRVDERGRTHLPHNPYDSSLADDALLSQIRYLTPREVARLHGLPEAHTCHDTSSSSCGSCSLAATFSWPAEVTRLQVLALLGNSLSCDCVSWLLAYLLMEPSDAEHRIPVS